MFIYSCYLCTRNINLVNVKGFVYPISQTKEIESLVGDEPEYLDYFQNFFMLIKTLIAFHFLFLFLWVSEKFNIPVIQI